MITETQINNGLNKRKKEERWWDTGSFIDLPKETKTDLIWENREMLILKNFSSFEHLLPKSSVFLIDIIGYFFKFLLEDRMVIHHKPLYWLLLWY